MSRDGIIHNREKTTMQRRTTGQGVIVGLLLGVLLVALCEPAAAVSFTWNTTSGTFSNAGAWTPVGGPPGTADDAYFRTAGTYNVSLAGGATIARLYFGDIFAGTQAVTMSGGTLSASYAYLGTGAGSANNSLVLDGAGTVLSTSPNQTYEDGVQITGTGNSLTISNGAGVSTTGVVTVAGTGGSLIVNGGTLTASGGTSRSVRLTGTNGLLSVLNGGTVTASGRYVIIGDGAAASGATLNLTSGTVQGSRLFVGTGGATGGSATITGAASLFQSLSGGGLYVGDGSNSNTLTVSAGATAQAAGIVYVGTGTGTGNQVTVSGGGATLRGNQANDWVSSIEFGGSGNTLTVGSGGVLTTGGGQVAIYGTNNELAITGGTVTVNGTGRTGIGLNVNTYYGTTYGSGATLTMSGGTLTTTGDIAVAGGSYTQSGGTASASRLLAGTAGASGTTTSISGPTTTVTTSHPHAAGILVGNSANANTLTVSGGASASAANLVQVGAGTGTGNQLLVTGAGSQVQGKNANNWQPGVLLDGTSNILTIETGATVSTLGGQVQILGTNNTVEVAGGTLNVPNSFVGLNCNGYYGTLAGSGATLNVTGGTVSTSQLVVGGGSFTQTGGATTVHTLLAGAYGANGSTTTVSGAGTTLAASSNILVGYDSGSSVGSVNNTLRVEDGARVTSQGGSTVGSSSGGGSRLVITGAGSTFASGLNGQYWDSWLRVGATGGGNNTVEVSAGGTLSTVGLSVGATAGNAIHNVGGVFEFRADKGLCDPGWGGINLTDGTISYKNTYADVRYNNAAVYPSHPGNAWAAGIADITFAGNNTFRMDNSSSLGYWDQTYTYDSVANTGNPRNYQGLELMNGTVAIPLGHITIGTGGRLLADNAAASITQSLTNRGMLTVDGDATLTVGTFSQTAGSATIDGTLSSANPLSFSGGSLGGSGTLAAPSVALAGATVAPGSSPGTLTVTGSYSQDAGSVLLVELAGLAQGVSYDWLEVGGTASLAGTLSVDATISPWFLDYGQTFTVVTATGGITDAGLLLGGPSAGWFSMSVGPSDVVLTSLIPEPTAALLLIAGVLGVWRRRQPRG
jgi:hypothetical protein